MLHSVSEYSQLENNIYQRLPSSMVQWWLLKYSKAMGNRHPLSCDDHQSSQGFCRISDPKIPLWHRNTISNPWRIWLVMAGYKFSLSWQWKCSTTQKLITLFSDPSRTYWILQRWCSWHLRATSTTHGAHHHAWRLSVSVTYIFKQQWSMVRPCLNLLSSSLIDHLSLPNYYEARHNRTVHEQFYCSQAVNFVFHISANGHGERET